MVRMNRLMLCVCVRVCMSCIDGMVPLCSGRIFMLEKNLEAPGSREATKKPKRLFLQHFNTPIRRPLLVGGQVVLMSACRYVGYLPYRTAALFTPSRYGVT